MKKRWILLVTLAFFGCTKEAASAVATAAPTAAAPAAAAVQPSKEAAAPEPAADLELGNTVAGIAAGSKDHTTLVAALKAAGLVGALASRGGVYTVFAPTNAAFEKLPAGTVEGLLKPEKKADLTAILKHHAAVPILQVKDLHDGATLAMSDGTKVTFHVKDSKVMVDDANIVASIAGDNGIVHVVDGVLLPPAK